MDQDELHMWSSHVSKAKQVLFRVRPWQQPLSRECITQAQACVHSKNQFSVHLAEHLCNLDVMTMSPHLCSSTSQAAVKLCVPRIHAVDSMKGWLNKVSDPHTTSLPGVLARHCPSSPRPSPLPPYTQVKSSVEEYQDCKVRSDIILRRIAP
jgi:hypothetical protein